MNTNDPGGKYNIFINNSPATHNVWVVGSGTHDIRCNDVLAGSEVC